MALTSGSLPELDGKCQENRQSPKYVSHDRKRETEQETSSKDDHMRVFLVCNHIKPL